MPLRIEKEIENIRRLNEILLILFEEGFGFLIDGINLGSHIPIYKKIRSRFKPKEEIPLPIRLRRTFERLGWWDDGFQFYAADNDFALTIRDNQMHVVGFESTDRVIHIATADHTRQINEKTAESDFARLREKWQTKIGTIVQQEMQKEGKFRSLKQTEISTNIQTIKPQ